MDKFDSKIVSFRRDADYLRQRAMKNRREGKKMDALELMRQALTREPDNADYIMQLADMYSEMGLYEQSNRLFMRIMPRGETMQECLYLMANNLYHSGDVSKAERVLRAYVESDARGERVEEAKRLLSEIEYAKEIGQTHDRKLSKAMRLTNRACSALREGNPEEAAILFEKSLAIRNRESQVRALHALALFMSGRRDEAREELDELYEGALQKTPNDEYSRSKKIKTACIAAQVYAYLERRDRAREIMKSIQDEDAEESDALLRINALCEMHMYEEGYECICRALRDKPYDKKLLHSASVTAHHCGMSAEEVESGWQKIVRLDPDDLVAAYYLKAAQEGKLPPMLSYAYMLPPDEMLKCFHYISERVKAGDEALKDAWKNDEHFRKILEWELIQDNERLTRTALTVLAGIPDEETRMLVRVYAERPDVSIELRMYALSMMRIQSILPDMQLRESFLSAGMPSEEEIMSNMPVGQKQMIRYAAEYVEDMYDDYPVADIALIWRAFLEARGSASDPVGRTEAGSAALAMVYLQMRGKEDDIYTVSKWYGCSPRQAAHIARRFRDVIGMTDSGERKV